MVGEPQGRCRLPSQWARTQLLGTLDRVRQLRPYSRQSWWVLSQRGRPWPPSRDPGKNPVEPVGFHGHGPRPRLPRSTLAWGRWALGVLVCGPATQQLESTPGSGALRSAQSPNCTGIPLGPFEVAAHAPFPSLPCLPKRPGFSRLFTFHIYVGLNGLRRLLRSIPGHWTLSPVPPPSCLKSLPPFSTFLPTSSVPPWHPFPTAVPVHRPAHTHPTPTPTKYTQVFDLPETQVYCERSDGPVSRMATHTVWGFFRCTLMLAPPQPTPYSKCPGETSETGHCTHYS